MVKVPRLLSVLAAAAVIPIGLALTPGVASASNTPAAAGRARAAVRVVAGVNSSWDSCNSTAVRTAPKVLWTRIEGATADHRDIPASFWKNVGYRRDIARIVCYESTFDYRAVGAGQYGWFQMSQGLISSEHVTFYDYWNGNAAGAAGWYQCTAGERYILGRYGNPAAAWQHEEYYGWY